MSAGAELRADAVSANVAVDVFAAPTTSPDNRLLMPEPEPDPFVPEPPPDEPLHPRTTPSTPHGVVVVVVGGVVVVVVVVVGDVPEWSGVLEAGVRSAPRRRPTGWRPRSG